MKKILKLTISFLLLIHSTALLASAAADKAEEAEIEYQALGIPAQQSVLEKATDRDDLEGFSVSISGGTREGLSEHSPVITLTEEEGPIALQILLTYYDQEHKITYNLSKTLPGINFTHLDFEGFWQEATHKKTSTSTGSKVLIQKNPIAIPEPIREEPTHDVIQIPERDDVFKAFAQKNAMIDGFLVKEAPYPTGEFDHSPHISTVQDDHADPLLLEITYYDAESTRALTLSKTIPDVSKQDLKFEGFWNDKPENRRAKGPGGRLLSPKRKTSTGRGRG